MKIKHWSLLIATVVGVLLSQQSQASFVFGYGGAVVNQSGGYILGNDFVVNTPVAVTQLGVFDQDLPSSGSIAIGIYANAGSSANWTLVNGTLQTITSGALVDPVNQTAYINIAPVVLAAGLYSVVTTTSSDYNSGFVYPNPSAVTFNGLAGVTQGAYDIWAPGSSLAPTLSGMQTTGPGTEYPWALPVFGAGTLSVSAVPEPTTVVAGALLLLPFGFSTLRVFRKSRIA